ncbi:MAG: GTP-binding protein [Promethearchaeota archaeon]|nr:MAG: GTP-binding protein [Candidatus Lokiarchaeota archaeon]
MENKYRVLNVLVAGHAQHGKSSLIEVIVGKFPDILDYELAHGTTVNLKVIQFLLKKSNILLNFLDSPGHADFRGGIALGLEFADLLLLVISGSEGFQARTYWLYEEALKKNLPIIIAATKMDLPSANTNKIYKELNKLGNILIPVIETSSKKNFGIEDLIKRISLYIKSRDKLESELSFIVLGYEAKKGIGEVLNVGILSGKMESKWITEKVKIRYIFSLKGTPIKDAYEGDIVQISLNIKSTFDLGAKYFRGKFISPKIEGLLSEIQPRKEFYISIEDKEKFNIALDALTNLKKLIPSFDFYVEKTNINILVQGDVQFDFIKDQLETLIEFKVIGSKIKGIITINKISQAKYKSASVRIVPRCRKILTVSRENQQLQKLYDILGASAAYEAFNIDGLHVDIYSGKNEDDIAQAIAKAIEKIKLIKIVPHQDVIIKVENYHDVYSLIEKYEIEVLYQSQADVFFLQIKNEDFEEFFNSLMKISKGRADINLFRFDQGEIILSVDPGTRHYGFSLIERGELPSLWYVNLKRSIEDQRAHNVLKKQVAKEMDLFLRERKELINKIFIGNGPGANFIIDFFIEYFDIPCENNTCVITDLGSAKDRAETIKNQRIIDFSPPEIYLIDEFKTTKEALFHLQQGKLVSEVQTKGFVDHAIAALLIAKRGLKGEFIQIKKKPLKQLFDYIIENYAGSYSFSSIHNINSLTDLKPGMFLRVKDSSKLDTNLKDGEIVSFSRFGTNFKSIFAETLTGNKIIIKFQGNVKVKKEFFEILTPVKQKN